MPFGLVLASFDSIAIEFAQDFSSTPVKYWRTIIEPGGLRQGRYHQSKQIRELVLPLTVPGGD